VAVDKPIDANGESCASSFPACLCPVGDGDSSSAKRKKYDIVLLFISIILNDLNLYSITYVTKQ